MECEEDDLGARRDLEVTRDGIHLVHLMAERSQGLCDGRPGAEGDFSFC
jgi:hypothetical protein